MPADHEAHSQTQRRQLRRVAQSFGGHCSPEAEAEQAKPRSHPYSDWSPDSDGDVNSKNQSSPVHDRGKSSRAKPDERCRVQTFEAEAPATRCSRRRTEQPHNTQHGGIHDHAAKNQALETTRPRTAREESVRKRTRGSARGRANSSSNHRKSLTNQGTTLRRRCEYGARGARLTHSQAATPESEHSSSQQTG